MKSRTLLLAALMAVSAGAFAKDDEEVDTKVSALEGSFAEQRAQIEKDLAEGEVYEEIQPEHLKQVRVSLDEMSKLLEGVADVAQLSQGDRIELMNHQEMVNTILTMAEYDSRTVCRRTRSTGSHFKTTHCETIRDRRMRQERDRDEIARLQTKLQMIDRGG